MDEKTAALRNMQICRFCLTDKDPLSSIYEKESNKNTIPLSIQIMACVTIEVFANDGMPQLICDDCRLQTRKSYTFKTMCKRSDDALKLYLTTGVLPKQEAEDIIKLHPKNVLKRPASEVEDDTTAGARTPKQIKKSDCSVQVNMEPKPQPEKVAQTTQTPTRKPEVQDKVENVEKPEKDPIEVTEEAACETPAFEEVLVADFNITEESSKRQIIKPKQVVTHCYPCTQCERTFPLQQLLDIHMRQHQRERKFPCQDCDKKFFSKHDLAKHVQIHTGEKPYNCVVCKKTFSRATLLHRHEKTHVSVPKYLCSHCDKTYLTASDLDAHLVTHQKKRPFKCKQCDKSFAFKLGLERHELTHNIEHHQHKCDYCDDSFTTAVKLTRHIKVLHAGARPYPCKLCPRTFLLSHHLTRHLRLHYRNKNVELENGEHKCDYCSMSFRRKDSLVHHTAIHSMVNLKCVICNKEFDDVTYIKEHVTTHISGLPYPCDKCDYSFETQEELEVHEFKHYDNIADDDECCQDDQDQSESGENDDGDKSNDPIDFNEDQETTIKNYAEFLQEEICADFKDETSDTDQAEESPKVQVGVIPPVIRNETIKMYKGLKEKNQNKNVPVAQETQPTSINSNSSSSSTTTATTTTTTSSNSSSSTTISTTITTTTTTTTSASSTSESSQQSELPALPEHVSKPIVNVPNNITPPKTVTKITTLENLGISKQTLDSITQKTGVVEMKVGQKIVRVQKLMLTKAEYIAMAKKGQLERKGSKVVIQSLPATLDLHKLAQLSKNTDDVSATSTKVEIPHNVDIQVTKAPVRTYVKKVPSLKKDENKTSENVITQTKDPLEIEPVAASIDLAENTGNNDTSLPETEIIKDF